MSENSSIESDSCFDNYKLEDLEDLQSQLYANIYYHSNIEAELNTTDFPNIVQFNNITDEANSENNTKNQHDPNEQLENTRSTESEINKKSAVHDDICEEPEPVEFAQIDLSNVSETIVSKETNSMLHNSDDVNETSSNSSMIKEKKNMNNFSKKYKLSKRKSYQNNLEEDADTSSDTETYSKCNVLQKHVKQQILNKKLNEKAQFSDISSDSEQSIFEIPVPPKPKPLLISLHDSEEENNTNAQINKQNSISLDNKNNKKKDINLIVPVTSMNYNLDIAKKLNNHQNICAKNNSTSPKNNSRNLQKTEDKRIQTPNVEKSTPNVESIILNCTPIEKGIRNMSKTNNTNHREKTFATSPISSKNKVQQNMNVIETEYDSDYLEHVSPDFLNNDRMEICDNNNIIVINQKRQSNNNSENNLKIKRQCTQQSNQNTSQFTKNRENNNESLDVHFSNRMPAKLRNFCYSNQENFSVTEIQRGMSKDPKMWAILDEDKISLGSKQRGRFWNIKCTNCHENGHRHYYCPKKRKLPRCHMCGIEGHTESRCSKKMCLTCGKQQNSYRKTCEFCRVLYCTMCKSIGHKAQQCPDLWRRYHQTTSMHNVPTLQHPGNVMKLSNLLHCCNCAKRGHESSTCSEYQWSQHFVTPAAVTDYINGPRYTMSTTITLEPNISTSETISDSILSQSLKNTQPATGDTELSANLETLNVNTAIPQEAAYVQNVNTAIPQEAAYVQKIEKNLSLTNITDEFLCPKEDQKKNRKNILNKMNFIEVIYKCGTFDKNKKNAQLISHNLSTLNTINHYFLPQRRDTIIANLTARKIAPVFLENLQEKVQFEIKIGFVRQHKDMMIQIIAMRNYIDHLFQLLLHWIYIPDEEKDYGIDVNLPINLIKMYNLMDSKKLQLRKMCFVSYDVHTKNNDKDPRWLFHNIQQMKLTLQHMNKNTDKHIRLRSKLWRMQIKLLMLVNTEPKNNNYVSVYWEELASLLKQVRNKKINQKLSAQVYLKLILLYNCLFVPHTSCHLHKMLESLNRINKKMHKNMDCLSQTQQEFEIASHKQKNLALYTNENALSSSAVFCNKQDTNSIENSSIIAQQSANSNTSIEKRDVKDVLPGTSNMINDDEIIIISDSDDNIVDDDGTDNGTDDVNFQTTRSLTTQLVQSKYNVRKNKAHPIRNSRVHLTARNENAYRKQEPIHPSEKQKKKLNKKNIISDKIHMRALRCIKEARAFKLSHMINAADELQKKIDHTPYSVTYKHISTLNKLIQLEKKHQKNINSYCSYLQM